uniref:Cytokinesis protein sepH n=1 Tax=Lygus hesperus TaxID=30085 RepID=A0A0A9XMW9_LYGHE
MAYVPGTTLHTLVTTFGALPERQVVRYTQQLLQALAVCHRSGIIHRDLTSTNVLLTLHDRVVIIDFASARVLGGGNPQARVSNCTPLTPLWSAPEMYTTALYSCAVDIWSLGCVVLELLTGRLPSFTPTSQTATGAHEPLNTIYRLTSTDSTFVLPSTVTPDATRFLQSCFERNPSLRITAQQALLHPWIQSYTPPSHIC